jgi:hypothetical protein
MTLAFCRKVLDCGAAAPLSLRPPKTHGVCRASPSVRWKSGRALPQSKTLARHSWLPMKIQPTLLALAISSTAIDTPKSHP